MGLGLDIVPAAKVEGCYFDSKKKPALGGPSWKHDTEMGAKVFGTK